MYERVYNFSSGPSTLPEGVLERAGSEILNYKGSGMSVMEMSHRGSAFMEIHENAKAALRRVLSVPDGYEILFLQGGASMQFSMVPLNLIGGAGRADYAVTGNFSSLAMKEAKKYGEISLACDSGDRDYAYIPAQSELKLDPDAAYFYYCANNTIYGTEWQYVPETGSVPLVCDMSSNILSKPVDVSRYGLILAGAQKNMAPAGLTVVIMKKELAGAELPCTPLTLSYKTMIDKDSMYNTPPCWCIYMLGLTLEWVEEQGGLNEMERRKKERAGLLYDFIDSSKLFKGTCDAEVRSDMNVRFTTGDADLDAQFAKEASKKGLSTLKGHRLTGGMRASIYNAMPVEGVHALIAFMKDFEKGQG